MMKISSAQSNSAVYRNHGRTLPYGISAPIGGEGISYRTCQWLEGEAKERNFCGELVIEGKSWCPEHYKRVFLRGSK